jgi:hypothetical protein
MTEGDRPARAPAEARYSTKMVKQASSVFSGRHNAVRVVGQEPKTSGGLAREAAMQPWRIRRLTGSLRAHEESLPQAGRANQ